MLNVGIIGNTNILEPHVKQLQKNKSINIIGKASVGTSQELNGFHFSIPEFNKVELIERADIFIIDGSSLLPFEILSTIIKKSKHIFLIEYLNITIDECAKLVKLAAESGSIVQVTNPISYTPAIQWLTQNITLPLFFDISKNFSEKTLREALFPLLLMLTNITGINSKKIGATYFESELNETSFTNIRFELSDASVVNMNLTTQISVNNFIIKIFSKNQFISLNFKEEIFMLNNSPIKFDDDLFVNEYNLFLESIQNHTQKNNNLEEYHSAMQIVEKIEKKITQFTV